MTHSFEIEGMTCGGCANTVRTALEKVPGVTQVKIDLQEKEATVRMERHIPTGILQKALGEKSKYTIREKTTPAAKEPSAAPVAAEETDYTRLYPLFLIFAFLVGGVLLVQIKSGAWDGMEMMQHFMGGFFVVFSFFKFLDLRGFAASFSTYDPIAARWVGYGFVYPFIELALGAAYLLGYGMSLVSLATLVILGIGTIGVARSVLNKRRIQCACLGTVFNLPMTKVTLIENSLMLIMAAGMLFII